jgi:hypothetical protein
VQFDAKLAGFLDYFRPIPAQKPSRLSRIFAVRSTPSQIGDVRF